jgi:pimeloyl-ACP methyl ester carboxylesterase
MDTKSDVYNAIEVGRRRFLTTAAVAVAGAHLGAMREAPVQSGAASVQSGVTPRQNNPASAFGLHQINAGLLNVGYVDEGRTDAPAVVLLHGWPYDIHSFVDVTPRLVSAGYRVIVPHLRGYGTTRFLSNDTLRNGQPAAVAMDAVELMDALKIERATIAGFDWGARSADIIAALWPERCKGLVSVSGYLIGGQAAGKTPLTPAAEYQWWYQFYFATERGRSGYGANRREFAKLIWQLASPQWKFDEATFERSAAAFENPDHVDIVIHNYRWRMGIAEGEAKYDDLERRLAAAPLITVPSITLEGDANGAPHPAPAAYANKFSGKYAHRTITGGIGHNLPQEAPAAFAQAILDVAAL